MTDTPITTNVLYNALYGTSPYPVPSALWKGTKTIRKWITHTVVSGEDSDDSVYVQRLEVGEYLVGINLVTDGLGASAGTGSTIAVTVTDEAASPATTTVAAAADMDASGQSVSQLAFAGMHFTPAVGNGRVAIVHATGAPVVGKIVRGWIDVMRHSA
jgi:hypothetical protein